MSKWDLLDKFGRPWEIEEPEKDSKRRSRSFIVRVFTFTLCVVFVISALQNNLDPLKEILLVLVSGLIGYYFGVNK